MRLHLLPCSGHHGCCCGSGSSGRSCCYRCHSCLRHLRLRSHAHLLLRLLLLLLGLLLLLLPLLLLLRLLLHLGLLLDLPMLLQADICQRLGQAAHAVDVRQAEAAVLLVFVASAYINDAAAVCTSVLPGVGFCWLALRAGRWDVDVLNCGRKRCIIIFAASIYKHATM